MSEFHTDAGAGQQHSDIAPELRLLAQAILDRLDPAVKLLAAGTRAGGAGKCEQVWCPVCAIAALVSGEQHPLLDVVAEHSAALLTLVRAMLDNFDSTPKSHDPSPGDPPEDEQSGRAAAPEPGHYEPITVVIKDSADSVE